ncbi:hypothetical protein ASG89_05220 [Paenibacillus sp. Soil766]|nr:hypothetical protein ASG89_05220 [Paenibacillus sp. Soil766]
MWHGACDRHRHIEAVTVLLAVDRGYASYSTFAYEQEHTLNITEFGAGCMFTLPMDIDRV